MSKLQRLADGRLGRRTDGGLSTCHACTHCNIDEWWVRFTNVQLCAIPCAIGWKATPINADGTPLSVNGTWYKPAPQEMHTAFYPNQCIWRIPIGLMKTTRYSNIDCTGSIIGESFADIAIELLVSVEFAWALTAGSVAGIAQPPNNLTVFSRELFWGYVGYRQCTAGTFQFANQRVCGGGNNSFGSGGFAEVTSINPGFNLTAPDSGNSTLFNKLAICHACPHYVGTRSACEFLTDNSGVPCAATLSQRLASGQPCPDPAGDRWALC